MKIVRNPIAVTAVVQSGLALAMAFGAHLTTLQAGMILTFTSSLFTLFGWKTPPPGTDAPAGQP